MKILPSITLGLMFLGFWSCSDSGEPKLEGCTDSGACNYSVENTHDDGSCWTPTTGCSCSEAAGAVVDECEVCGGSGPIDVNHDCDGTCIVSTDTCGTCGGTVVNPADCCPEGQVSDCAGECGGIAVIDCNGDCGGSVVEDCAGTCGGTAVKDNCEECGGDNSTCVNYSTEIQPILTANCTSCHGGSGGLTLTSYSDLMGNDVVDPGNSMTSKLIQRLKGTSGTQMPKNQDPLDEATINLIETWIDEGALDN